MKTVIRCIDFETTGFPPTAGVCEIGWTDLIIDDGEVRVSETQAYLCNPGMPIGDDAAKVHGIHDGDVADAPSSAKMFMRAGQGADIFCAHNAEFERAFFDPPGSHWICTYKVALARYPGLPNHRNGTIPGHLGIDLDPERCASLHRAGPDTYVTAMILMRFMADGISVEEMLEITRRPKKITRVPFGRLKGALISELTVSELRNEIDWITRAPDVREALIAELRRREAA